MSKSIGTIIFAIAFVVASVKGQGTFQNLDFEQARIIFENTGFIGEVAATNALPGWSAFAGVDQLSIIKFGSRGAFFPVQLYANTNGGSIAGNFSVMLASGSSNTPGSISQTGLVPADARSLLFKAAPLIFSSAPLTVSMDGQNLSYAAVSTGANYTMYGANISSHAGQVATLSFMAGSARLIDDIQFSSQPIPEPSAFSLIFLVGGLLLCALARRRHLLY